MANNDPPKWRKKWAIGMYSGPGPFSLSAPSGLSQPIFTSEHVADAPATSVADPFLLRRDGLWHLFFEFWNSTTGRGEIGHASGSDPFSWSKGMTILREPFHLSYPCVVQFEGETFLIPESRGAGGIRLYRAEEFPARWSLVRTLVEGPYADPTVFELEGHWWMFAQRGLDELRLFGSPALDGSWSEHPSSPILAGNRRVTRPGGRVISFGGRLIRFAQDGFPSYGHSLRAIAVETLTPERYHEREIPESPILTASGAGWNGAAMHHLDAQLLPDGSWIGAVDGATFGFY